MKLGRSIIWGHPFRGKMGRMWVGSGRYADSKAFEKDTNRGNLEIFGHVIQAFNME